MKEKYEYEPHTFNRRVCHWLYCSKCGLVMMKNDFSQWAQRVGCNNELHPRYEAVRKGAKS